MCIRDSCQTVEDLYAALGYGGIQLWRLMPRIRDNYNKIKKPVEESQEVRYQKAPSKATGGVIIDGIDNCLIKFSKCCNPLPGDDIIGFITRGYGVSIHKRSCTNVPKDISKAAEPERWVNARWAGEMCIRDRMKDVALLDKMYDLNLMYFKELTMYILAGKKKLKQVRENDLPILLDKAKMSGLPEDAQAANDLDVYKRQVLDKVQKLQKIEKERQEKMRNSSDVEEIIRIMNGFEDNK